MKDQSIVSVLLPKREEIILDLGCLDASQLLRVLKARTIWGHRQEQVHLNSFPLTISNAFLMCYVCVMLSVLFFFFIVFPFSLNSLCFCQDHQTLLYLPHKLTFAFCFITHLQHTLKVPMNDHHGMARLRFLLMTLMNGLICNTSKPRQLMKTHNNSKEVSHNLNITPLGISSNKS